MDALGLDSSPHGRLLWKTHTDRLARRVSASVVGRRRPCRSPGTHPERPQPKAYCRLTQFLRFSLFHAV
ncbi:hypothetical protein L226DRAFT_144382 [Lentinus tigrinus ALCF2SS1-7]|uniref:uncharacterized protein n=1 Tax=Lentinus tigrinus ALCF2SS1-7 TaxID=1328758 RepID=UPI001165FCC1|nr:hypothetical protein L226DRAFT_144382 [Lentinus tigrinus ALCF2SS1-7]